MPSPRPSSPECFEARTTPKATFCRDCQSLLVRPEELAIPSLRISYVLETINRSALEGCPLCVRFSAMSRQAIQQGKLSKTGSLEAQLHCIDRSGRGSLESFLMGATPSSIDLSAITAEKDKIHVLSIQVAERGNNVANAEIRPVQGSDETPTSFPISTNITAPSSMDEARLKIVGQWIRDCLNNHTYCNRSAYSENTIGLPSRLIDTRQNRARLVLPEEFLHSTPIRYVTLSHKWGHHHMPKLLKSNVEILKHNIDVIELPAVFQDTFSLSRRLRIAYVWVDSLCIIQDSAVDCELEIAKMRAIYSNAFCNFGAIAAAETHAGLFVDSDPCLISAFPFTFKRQHRDMDCYGSSAKGSTVIDRSNLMKRGWVLQERMLSPRSVFFDEQLRWECSEMVACETLPKGQLSRENLMSYHPPLRVHSLHPGGNSSLSEERIKDVHNRWLELVETYTRCDLTFEKDKLPAISGLAKCFNKIIDDQYLAGLWRKHIIQGLLWYRPYQLQSWEALQKPVYPKEYRAPSWSWAAVKFSVRFIDGKRSIEWSRCHKLAVVLEATPMPDDIGISEIAGARIRISSCLRQSQRGVIDPSILLLSRHEWYDDPHGREGQSPSEGSFLLLLIYGEPYTRHVAALFGDFCEELMPAQVRGLILEPVQTEPGTFRRIGMFNHPVGSRCSEEQLERYPEFQNFDPEDFETSTLTLI